MNLKEIVAVNLRDLCSKEPSVAHVCRRLGVTPQKFNTYLQAKHLPSDEMLKKICNYFGIIEDTLYVSPRIRELSSALSPDSIGDRVFKGVNALKGRGEGSLDDGRYELFFYVQESPNTILRSLLFVETKAGFVTFRRLTSVNKEASIRSLEKKSIHTGVVFIADDFTYFLLGFALRRSNQPSLLVVKPALSATPIMSGHAIINSTKGPTTAKIALAPSRSRSIRGFLELEPIIDADSPEITSSIRAALDLPSIERTD